MDSRQGTKIFVVLSISVLAGSGAVAQPPFTEEATQRGVDYVAWKNADVGIAGQSQGAAFVDLDLDGDPDLILIGDATGVVGVYENDGTGHFTKRINTGMPILDHASAVTAADYDADGDLDIYITQFNNVALLPQPSGQNHLLRNDGGFTFTDVTVEANVYDLGASTGPTWGDYDGDGYLDLYVPNYSGVLWEPTDNRLYHNLGDGTFEEVAAVLGVDDLGAGFQASFVDYDLDGDVDLYLVNDRGVILGYPNRLWKNLGDGTFQDVSEESGADLAICGMGLAVGDIDRDGWPDFYVSNTTHNPLLMNQEGTAFVDQSVLWDVEGGLSGWGVMFFDMDNDAYLDIYVCNTLLGQSGLFADRLYDCDGSPPCGDIAPEMGLNVDTPAYGVTSADIDNDGDLDFVIIRPSGKLPDWGVLPVLMYINHADNGPNNWLKVRLEGAAPNYFGVGATVLLEDDLAAGGIAWQQRMQISGSYYKSQQDMDLHFGVGATVVVGEVRVLWPSGVVSIVNDVAVNQTLVIQEIPTLESLTVSGPTVVAASTVAYFTASALYSDDSIVNVTGDAVWSLDPMDYAAFTAPGELTAGAPSGDVTVEISASFDDMVSNTHIITIVAASPVDLDPPSVTITEPTDDEAYATEEASIQLTGQAADAYGVTFVEWRVNDGPAVPCSGTTTWSTGSIDLAAGENEVTITARDGAGNVGSDVLLVTLTPAGGSEPILAVSVTSVDFGQTEETRELAVWNDGDGDLDYFLTSDAAWLTVMPLAGSSNGADDVQTHTLTIDRDAFDPGATLTASIIIVDDAAAAGPITVAVSAEAPPAEAAAPSLDVSADVLDFGTEGATRELSVFNAGGGTLNYEIIVDDPWIAVDPGSGASSGIGDVVVHTVSVNRTGFEPGETVSGTLKIVPDDAAIETITVSVSATSEPPATIDEPVVDNDLQPDEDGTAAPEPTASDPAADADVPSSDDADDGPSDAVDDEPSPPRNSGCGMFGMLSCVAAGFGMGLLRSRARRCRRRN